MKDNERKRIAESIRAARLAAGLTQVDVSRAAAISQPSVSAIESGESQPSIQSLIRLADAYRVTLDDLVGRTVGEGEKNFRKSGKTHR